MKNGSNVIMNNYRAYSKSNTTGASCGAGTSLPSGALEFTTGF